MAGRRSKKGRKKTKVFAGRYAYAKPLGRGAGGSVYLAEDLLHDRRRVALKVLTAEACKTVQGKMLRREFEILSKLDHPYLVRVYDYGRMPDGGVFLAEEYIEGFSLQDARALLEPSALIDVTLQILHALSYLHGMGTIHRDIKPANVMLLWSDDAEARPLVKLVDFGLSSMDPKRDTLRGGTRSYMAPEIIRGEKGEPRSDLFSLGVTLYYALCGVLPFGPRSKSDPPPTEEDFRPPEPHRLNPEVPLPLSRFTMVLLRQVSNMEFADAGEALQSFGRDTESSMHQSFGGQLANSLDLAATPVLRGFFEHGIVAAQAELRERLIDRLGYQETSEDTGRYRGTLTLLEGRPQVGKSRLLREIEASVKLSGRSVIRLRCRPDDLPYAVVLELLERLVERVRSRHGTESPTYPRLTLLVERLGHILHRSPELLEALGEGRWLAEALAESVALLDAERLLIVVEDLQYVDDATLHFLEMLYGPRYEGTRPDILASSRPSEDLREVFERIDGEHLEVGVLTEEDVADFFGDRLGLARPDAAWCAEVARAADGKPDYLEELCRTLVDQGVLQREGAQRWSLDEAALEQVALPQGITESIRRRLGAIGGTAREALELLAIFDRRVSWMQLSELVSDDDTARVDRAIETLRWRHFTRLELSMEGRHVRLIHGAVREVLLGLMSEEWRRALHRRVGHHLRDRWRDGRAELDEAIEHLLVARLDEDAHQLEHILIERAMTDPEEEVALTRVPRVSTFPRENPDVVLRRISRAQLAVSRFDPHACREHVEEASELAERTALDWLMARAFQFGARMGFTIADPKWARQWLHRMTDCLPTMARQQPDILEIRARLALDEGALDVATSHIERALEHSRHFGHTIGVCRMLSWLAYLHIVGGDTSRAMTLVQEALGISIELAPFERGSLALVHGMLLRRHDALDKATLVLQHGLQKLAARDAPDIWLTIFLELAGVHREQGDEAIALRYAQTASFFAERLEHAPLILRSELLHAEVLVDIGQQVDTSRLLERIHTLDRGSGSHALVRIEANLRLARLLDRTGDSGASTSRMKQGLDEARSISATGLIETIGG